MRNASLTDSLRRLQSGAKEWPISISRLAITDIPTLGSLEVSSTLPILVLSGPNGVGKTTLLRAVWAALDAKNAAAQISADKKLLSGRALVQLASNKAQHTAEVEFSSGNINALSQAELPVTYIDVAADVAQVQGALLAFGSTEEIINGVGSKALDAGELEQLNFILQRQYRQVTVYEVELSDEFGLAPFFEVAYGDNRYDSRTMGAGEAAAFYLWWKFDRSPKGSVILLEEPEAFLSFGCQETLAAHIVAQAASKLLCIVVSTHSAPLINLLPKECTKFISRDERGIHITSSNPPRAYLHRLGIEAPLRALAFVEDSAGAEFTRLILEKFDPLLSRSIQIERRNGDGGVVTALRLTETLEGNLRFVAFLDGDIRGKLPDDVARSGAFLPGNIRVERAFREMNAKSPEKLAELTGNPDLSAILASLEGDDDHDWFEKLAKELAWSKAHLFQVLFGIWIRDTANLDAAKACYEEACKILELPQKRPIKADVKPVPGEAGE